MEFACQKSTVWFLLSPEFREGDLSSVSSEVRIAWEENIYKCNGPQITEDCLQRRKKKKEASTYTQECIYVCIYTFVLYVNTYEKLIKFPYYLVNMQEYIPLKGNKTESNSEEGFVKVCWGRKPLKSLHRKAIFMLAHVFSRVGVIFPLSCYPETHIFSTFYSHFTTTELPGACPQSQSIFRDQL